MAEVTVLQNGGHATLQSTKSNFLVVSGRQSPETSSQVTGEQVYFYRCALSATHNAGYILPPPHLVLAKPLQEYVLLFLLHRQGN